MFDEVTMKEDQIGQVISVVLVEPQDSLNIGSVARAMKNLGYHRLTLVAPERYSEGRASITACGGGELLSSVSIVSSFEEALGSVKNVVGFSARTGKNRVTVESLPRWASTLLNQPLVETALVFGPEDTGLRQEHLELCRHIVSIPTYSSYSSYNLAQAVLLVLFALRHPPQDVQKGQFVEVTDSSLSRPSWNEFFQLDRLVIETLTRAGFIRKGTPAPIPGVIKGLLRRIDPSQREMGILLGVFGKINTALKHHGVEPPRDLRVLDFEPTTTSPHES
jgi:TrmH family RNA methyltransferase